MAAETKAERRRRMEALVAGAKAAVATRLAEGVPAAGQLDSIVKLENRLEARERVDQANAIARRMERP